VNPQYLGKCLSLELIFSVLPVDSSPLSSVDTLRESCQVPFSAWAASHGLNASCTRSLQSLLSAPTIDLLGVPFSSCFTGGRYDGETTIASLFQHVLLSRASQKSKATRSSSCERKREDEKARESNMKTSSLRTHEPHLQDEGGEEEETEASSSSSRQPHARTEKKKGEDDEGKEEEEEQEEEEEKKRKMMEDVRDEEDDEQQEELNPYKWWAPPIGAAEDFLFASSSAFSMDGLSDRLGRTMELLVQSLATLSSPGIVSQDSPPSHPDFLLSLFCRSKKKKKRFEPSC
ncbi:trapp trafficking subunit, partial [Cystoisospora suis]